MNQQQFQIEINTEPLEKKKEDKDSLLTSNHELLNQEKYSSLDSKTEKVVAYDENGIPLNKENSRKSSSFNLEDINKELKSMRMAMESGFSSVNESMNSRLSQGFNLLIQEISKISQLLLELNKENSSKKKEENLKP